MPTDITDLLSEWPPDEVSVRVIHGADGRLKIQKRLAMGLLQLEMDGRPDGARPNGFDSYLEYFQTRKDQSRDAFHLDASDCKLLAAEALLYFQRRLCFFELRDYENAARDARRNLDAFSFARDHAMNREDAWMLEQYRGFVLYHLARAEASSALVAEDYSKALEAIDRGLASIREFMEDHSLGEAPEQGEEIGMLMALRDRVERAMPKSRLEQLRSELSEAVEREEYELAAELRNQIRSLTC